jgi:hypothetical protein
MVIETIVGGIISALAWKAAEKASEKAGEAIVENRVAILEKVKELLKSDELITLNLLEKYPENTDLQKEFTEVVTPRLQANSNTTKEIETLLSKLEASLQIKRNEMKVEGNDNIAMQDVSGSSIKINKA